MKKIVFIAANLAVLGGCAATNKQSDRYSLIKASEGVATIEAVVTNPAPKCNDEVSIVRLDKLPELQVKVDVENGGKVCK